MSVDPALKDYVPERPVDKEARKRNGNLPGEGGVFNAVNLNVYHYAGNNPIRYVDPHGTELNFGIPFARMLAISVSDADPESAWAMYEAGDKGRRQGSSIGLGLWLSAASGTVGQWLTSVFSSAGGAASADASAQETMDTITSTALTAWIPLGSSAKGIGGFLSNILSGGGKSAAANALGQASRDGSIDLEEVAMYGALGAGAGASNAAPILDFTKSGRVFGTMMEGFFGGVGTARIQGVKNE